MSTNSLSFFIKQPKIINLQMLENAYKNNIKKGEIEHFEPLNLTEMNLEIKSKFNKFKIFIFNFFLLLFFSQL